jgi:hypothetical protein
MFPIWKPLGYAPSDAPPLLAQSWWNSSRPADFPADNLVPQAILMIDAPSAEAKESVPKTLRAC